MKSDRRLNMLFDEMLEDVKYSKIAAFTRTLYQIEARKKETIH